MKIGFFGDGLWAHKSLEQIMKKEYLEIAYIVGRYDSVDLKLKEYASLLNVPFYSVKNVNSDEFVKKLSSFKIDLNVSMSFNQILKNQILNLAPKGFINCHAGKLPYYRGRNVLNWALINGEKEFGVTVHYVDEGIDTGDIIVQYTEPISLEDDYSSLLQKAYNLCPIALLEAIDKISDDKVVRIKQSTIHPLGFYCGRRKVGDEWIDWNWSSLRIHNFVRAITLPGPCARTKLNEQVISIVKTEFLSDALEYIGNPGEVIGVLKDGILVKTGDSFIKILYIFEGDNTEFQIPSYPIGTRFI